MTDLRLTRLVERRDRALDDLLELERQLEAGEVDPDRAERLRARYEAEAADAMAAIDLHEATPPPTGRSMRRVAAGVGAVVVVAAVAVVALVNAVEPRPAGGFVTGGVAEDAATGDGAVDLSEISNEEMEEVVAANPDVIPMRLALARRYVEEGDFSSALGHYFYVLEREENPEALMYVGWMTHASGDSETGAALIERSLEHDPDNVLAQWFLANVRFHGLDDPEGAIPLLEAVLDSGLAPPEVVAAAEEMLAEARA